MRFSEGAEALLSEPQDGWGAGEREASTYKPLHTYDLPKGSGRQYSQQFADMYFTRLALLREDVERVAEDAWQNFELAGSRAEQVERVLDVRQGRLCWVIGIVFIEMPLKPNVLDDISKEHWIAAPPSREKYISTDGSEQVMLEDASGRLRLVGPVLTTQLLVSGCIIAALGTENADGEFEVADVKVADLPPHPTGSATNGASGVSRHPAADEADVAACKVLIVSGLNFDGQSGVKLAHELLSDFLIGEAERADRLPIASKIVRMIIAGDSLSNASPILSREEFAEQKAAHKGYGYDATTYNAAPSQQLDEFLSGILPHVPITLLPGASDPVNVSLPQQPMHPAILPKCKVYTSGPSQPQEGKFLPPGSFDCVTNPWEGDIEGVRFLGTGGQPIDDIFKYVDDDDRLLMMEYVLRWRVSAPTAPDTLWSYPFQDEDPNVIKECPHVYFVGNQPAFETRVITGPPIKDESEGQSVRLIAVPKFSESGIAVLLDTVTLQAEAIAFEPFTKH